MCNKLNKNIKIVGRYFRQIIMIVVHWNDDTHWIPIKIIKSKLTKLFVNENKSKHYLTKINDSQDYLEKYLQPKTIQLMIIYPKIS